MGESRSSTSNSVLACLRIMEQSEEIRQDIRKATEELSLAHSWVFLITKHTTFTYSNGNAVINMITIFGSKCASQSQNKTRLPSKDAGLRCFFTIQVIKNHAVT